MVCVCVFGGALYVHSVCLQLIKGSASTDYSHVMKWPLFSSPLIKYAAWRKSRFNIILMLVWACRKMQTKKKKRRWFVNGNPPLHLLFIISTDPIHTTSAQTHTLATFTFSLTFFAALCVLVGMLDGKSVTMHLYSRPC